MKKVLFSKELLDHCKDGKKAFSDIILQYIDMSDMDLSGLIIKNSKLFFATFRNCNFKNAKFINCEVIYGSFYGGNLEGVIFDNCTIDMTLFQDTIFRDTKISKSRLIWSAFLNTAMGEIDLSSSTKFKVFTDLSQITAKDVEDGMAHLGPLIDSLDMSIRHKIKQELEKDFQSLGIKDLPNSSNDPEYQRTSPLVYGMQNFSAMVIDTYNTSNPYRQKKSIYEKEGGYKS